jgi:Zn-dependent M32 family carboxypeptidase
VCADVNRVSPGLIRVSADEGESRHITAERRLETVFFLSRFQCSAVVRKPKASGVHHKPLWTISAPLASPVTTYPLHIILRFELEKGGSMDAEDTMQIKIPSIVVYHSSNYLFTLSCPMAVTYPLHIILRFELERGLFDGSVAVADLPKVWGEKMMGLLGKTLFLPSGR